MSALDGIQGDLRSETTEIQEIWREVRRYWNDDRAVSFKT